jgi:hypothetical protein
LKVEDEEQSTLFRQLRNIGIVLWANVLFFWQLSHPVLLFSSPTANDFIGWILALGFPWLAGVRVFLLGRRWALALGIVLTVPLLLYSALALFVMLFTAGGGSMDQIAETAWNGSAVRVYLLNGGATTDWGVLIRQERAILPSVLLVRRLYSIYHCHSLDLASTDAGVRIGNTQSDCEAFASGREIYRLKRFVYF